MDAEILLGLLETLRSSLGTVSFALKAAGYILMALGLYTIASRRQISNAWLAWIPGVNLWLLGSISDQYRYVARGERTHRRWILLGLKIAEWVADAVVGILAVVGITRLVFHFFDFNYLMAFSEEVFLEKLLQWGLRALGILLVMLPVTITKAVFYCMSLYDLYMSCEPKNAALYTVLSILVGVTRPFFVFFSRDKELGMPPRRPEFVPDQDPCCSGQAAPQTPAPCLVTPCEETAGAAEEAPQEEVLPAEQAAEETVNASPDAPEKTEEPSADAPEKTEEA